MTTDEGPEGRQRTVAELLRQYGDGGGRAASRRRRRADDDEAEDARAEAGADRTDAADADADAAVGDTGVGDTGVGDTGTRGERVRGRRAEQPDRDRRRDAGETRDGTAGPAPPQVPPQRWDARAGLGRSVDPLTGEPIDPPAERIPGGTQGFAPDRGRAGRTDPPTEQLPRYPDAGPLTGPLTGPVTGPLGWGAVRGRRDPAADDGPPTGQLPRTGEAAEGATDGTTSDRADGAASPGPAGRPAGGADASSLAGAAPAGLADRDDSGAFTDHQAAPDQAGPLGAGGWLRLVGQWLVGAVLGALLWVGFSWLWTNYPLIALVAAVLATVGLVLVVRAIRRSDDLQTTMLAVLVGLVVTISPAVLLLTGR